MALAVAMEKEAKDGKKEKEEGAAQAQLAHRHVFGFKSGVKGNMHFTDDAHLLPLSFACFACFACFA